MDRTIYQKRLLVIAALWNWAVTGVFFTLSVAMPSAFVTLGFVIPNSMLWFHCSIGIVGVFGVAYMVASRDPKANRGLLMVCVVEKFFFFLVFTIYFFIGDVSIVGLLVVVVDLAFGILFLEVVLRTRKQ
nr:hypothetical protein [Candidatus Sigynarchaeota archaeon]